MSEAWASAGNNCVYVWTFIRDASIRPLIIVGILPENQASRWDLEVSRGVLGCCVVGTVIHFISNPSIICSNVNLGLVDPSIVRSCFCIGKGLSGKYWHWPKTFVSGVDTIMHKSTKWLKIICMSTEFSILNIINPEYAQLTIFTLSWSITTIHWASIWTKTGGPITRSFDHSKWSSNLS